METKKEIRKRSLEKRKALPPDIRQEHSRVITERVLCHPFFQCADTVLIYASFREEVDTTELILAAFEQGKTVAVPRVLSDNRMEFYEIHSMNELKPGYQGIPEPEDDTARLVSVTDEENGNHALMILPGAAFDRKGGRIGYGKGFYDAYLDRYPHFYKIGLAFSDQCVAEIITEAHDVCVDAVLTELGDYKRGAR